MYLFLKLIHVTAAIIFLGNIITGLFWKAHADRTGDPRTMGLFALLTPVAALVLMVLKPAL